MAYDLKPFFIDFADLAFLLGQVNFRPLFDSLGNAVVQWDGSTEIFDAKGVLLSSGSSTAAGRTALIEQFGTSFSSVGDSSGVRDVTGTHNNLFSTQQFWGAVDKPFVRQLAADYAHYVTSDGANYTLGSGTGSGGFNVTDLMPRVISRTITTGGVNLLTERVPGLLPVTADNPDGSKEVFVTWDAARYITDGNYRTLIDMSGLDMSLIDPLGSAIDPNNHRAVVDQVLVDGAKIVAPTGLTLAWDGATDVASTLYKAFVDTVAGTGAKLYGGPAGEGLVDGGEIWASTDNGTTFAQLLGGVVKFNAALYLYHDEVVASGVDTGTLASGDAIHVSAAQISTAIAAASIGAMDASAAGGSSGYGLLDSLGQIDYQNPTSGEHFIGSENPGVNPVNSWFATFGQFFDHGLDFIDKGGNGKITIALDPSDPLYGAPGQDGKPVTSITISRATITGTDSYVDHTSPYIDQSQTYGSAEVITDLLREWVSTDGGATYHAGIRMFDGQTLADKWERRWPDGTSQLVNDTLPTLNELRDHVIDTKRAALTWEDVINYHSSGHALLLDMNPKFDAAHLNPNDGKTDTNWDDLVTGKVNAAFATISTALAGPFAGATMGLKDGMLSIYSGTTTLVSGVSALIATGLINPATFAITASDPAVHAAVGEILMASVGDHYIAGDGRVNENFGLTSIHHVFHEEHNYQVENLEYWIYKHDAANSPTTHDELHKWQNVTTSIDAKGNYLNADGSVAWNEDKFFNASKLMVEMEYQHAAVDQYARTITPRIQEFVGYSTNVNAQISLEFSQVAFRFGHSTIRETIDTVDPSGWLQGAVTRFALEKAFLNPGAFASEGIQAITLGLSRQQMNEVDEFVTPALNEGLLGQPLDLAAINIARGRDLGIPTLNDFRAAIGLAKYVSWDDYGKHMIHQDNLVNFIAAYSFGNLAGITVETSQAIAQYIMDTAAGVAGLVVPSLAGVTLPAGMATLADTLLNLTQAQALAFLRNAGSGTPSDLATAADGFNHLDAWLGGLAEEHTPGSLLGETFEAVFVNTIQQLMDGDRFYYLYRLFGTNLNEEVGNGQFKDIVERNTGLSHLNGSIFGYADKYYDFNLQSGQTITVDPNDKTDHVYQSELSSHAGLGIYSDGGVSRTSDGSVIHIEDGSTLTDGATGRDYILDTRVDEHPDQIHPVEGTPTDGADAIEVIVATNNGDFIHARAGDDTIYGEAGNDILYADGGADRTYGGAGDDYIDTGYGPDLADGGAGKDQIWGRDSGSEVGGFDQLVGGSGNDLIVGGEGIDKLSGGSGDDIIFGDSIANALPDMSNTDPFTHGGDGNDYIDGGLSGDLLYGDEGDDYIVGGGDQDFLEGDNGDDILRPSAPSQAAAGGGPAEVLGGDGASDTGFDLIDFSTYPSGGSNGALGVQISLEAQVNPLLAIDPRSPVPLFTGIEGIIGSVNNDVLVGDDGAQAPAQAPGEGGAVVNLTTTNKNWFVGGAGSDRFHGGSGTDLVIGGSVRLDALIGKYSDAGTAGNLQLGSLAWINDAMQSGGSGTGYDNNTEDAYTGASNRSAGTLATNSFIDGVNAGIAGTANDLEKHFKDLLQSRMFKDLTLGDGTADAGSTDIAYFIGNRNQYTITALNASGGVEANPGAAFAWKIRDNFNGDREVNDVLVGNDGTDIVIGVEALKFADRTVYLSPIAATGSVGLQLANNQGNNPNAVVLSGTSQLFDLNNATPTNLLGAVTAGITYTWFDAGTNAQIANGNLTQVTTGGRQVYLKASFTDALGVAESIQSSTYNLIVGTAGNNTLTGTNSLTVGDALFGLAGTDTLNGGDGNDYLAGMGGNDSLVGGAGNDTYVIDGQGTDTITEAAGAAGGVDTVLASVTHTLAANVENLTLQTVGGGGGGGANNFNGTGNILDNVITGNTGNNVLDGAGGTDTAVFNGAELNAIARINAAGNLTINIPGQGGGGGGGTPGSGTDTLINIEKVQFGTSLYDLVLGTNAANAALAGTATNNYIVGGQGNDNISAGAGDDIVVWGADNVPGGPNPPPATTDGRDFIDGGADTNNGTDGGDRVIINGNNQQETFTIYSNADGSAAAAGLTGLNANTEIVITRTVNNVRTIIAELDNVEEITINALDVSANDGDGAPNGGQTGGGGGPGGGGGDTVSVVGNFTATSLKYSTITVNGDTGNNTVDISGLTSAHRVVLNGNGGLDQVVGQSRLQDVVNRDAMGGMSAYTDGTLPADTPTPPAPADTGTPADTGSTTPPAGSTGTGTPAVDAGSGSSTSGSSSTPGAATGNGSGTQPPVDAGSNAGGSSGSGSGTSGASDDHEVTDSGTGSPPSSTPDSTPDTTGGSPAPAPDDDDTAPEPMHLHGDESDDDLAGEDADDDLFGDDGDDMMHGHGGNDHMHGGKGKDWLYGDDGDDDITGGKGRDHANGGAGDDMFHTLRKDGADVYRGGVGSDTLDMSKIMANIEVNLSKHHGHATAGGVTDKLYGIENITSGAGNDTIIASQAHNVMDGGAGQDVFKFKSAAHADGDTITGFEVGDRIDVSSFMGDHVTLVNGSATINQIAVTFEQHDGQEFTVLHGNLDANADDEFTISIKGHHNLTEANLA